MESSDLQYFRQMLQDKRGELITVVQRTENYGREADGDGEAMDIADKASSSYTKEFMFSKSNSDRQQLQMVAEALMRIDSGAYGECLNCGEEVERKRLEAVPWARLCITCQEIEERGR
jgi:DnaK suppressor protein